MKYGKINGEQVWLLQYILKKSNSGSYHYPIKLVLIGVPTAVQAILGKLNANDSIGIETPFYIRLINEPDSKYHKRHYSVGAYQMTVVTNLKEMKRVTTQDNYPQLMTNMFKDSSVPFIPEWQEVVRPIAENWLTPLECLNTETDYYLMNFPKQHEILGQLMPKVDCLLNIAKENISIEL